MQEPEASGNNSTGKKILIMITAIVLALCLILAYFFFMPGVFDGSPDGIIDNPDEGGEVGGDDGSGGNETGENEIEEPGWYEPPPAVIETSDWAVNMTQASIMKDRGFYGAGIVIGIVDSGIDPSHPEFQENSVIAWKDFVNQQDEPYDDNGHGTAMASIIISNGSIQGIAPESKLIVAKAINADGQGSDALVASAIAFCVDPNNDGDTSDGADIISLSLGGDEHPRFGSEVGDAATLAAEKGVFVIASAGNDGLQDDGDVESPASEELIIAVGAVDSNGTIAGFSSIGDNDGRTPQSGDDRFDPNKKPEIVAPGVDIVTAYPDGKYCTVSGTSPAAAYASGLLALILEENPGYLNTGNSTMIIELKNALMDGAKKLPGQDTPHDDHYGYGLSQAADTSDILLA